jgi:hypothetical protein
VLFEVVRDGGFRAAPCHGRILPGAVNGRTEGTPPVRHR